MAANYNSVQVLLNSLLHRSKLSYRGPAGRLRPARGLSAPVIRFCLLPIPAMLCGCVILGHAEADTNQREDSTMGIFVAVDALIVGVANISFQQGQANPDADSSFSSNSRIVQDGSSID